MSVSSCLSLAADSTDNCPLLTGAIQDKWYVSKYFLVQSSDLQLPVHQDLCAARLTS